jgi:DNA-binding NarL/FixJ family response regulator
MAERTRVLVADDHPTFRKGLRSLLEALGIEVVGEAATGAAAVELALELQPDVVVMDLQMPEGNGIDSTRKIMQASPHVGVLVLTMFEDDDSVFAAVRSGARGYLLKGAAEDQIGRAVTAVAAGEAIYGPGVAARVLSFFHSSGNREVTAFPQLTDRERQVLELISRGCNNGDIAGRLSISHKTVRNHVSNVFAKLHVADRAQAIVRARESGLGAQRSL